MNVRSKVHTVYLVKFGFGYRLIADTFYKWDKLVLRDGVKGGKLKEFETQDNLDEY